MKKHYKKIIILSCDILIIPIAILCKYLSQFMLTFNSPCFFSTLGGKCISCGGTHFVKDLLSGNFIDAFFDNQFFFICVVYLAISLVLLNLFLLFDLKFAKRALRIMYSIPSLICFLASIFIFLFVRNLPFIFDLLEKSNEILSKA